MVSFYVEYLGIIRYKNDRYVNVNAPTTIIHYKSISVMKQYV